jgi:hypothetical protein
MNRHIVDTLAAISALSALIRSLFFGFCYLRYVSGTENQFRQTLRYLLHIPPGRFWASCCCDSKGLFHLSDVKHFMPKERAHADQSATG